MAAQTRRYAVYKSNDRTGDMQKMYVTKSTTPKKAWENFLKEQSYKYRSLKGKWTVIPEETLIKYRFYFDGKFK